MDKKILGKFIKNRRMELQITQSEFAKTLDETYEPETETPDETHEPETETAETDIISELKLSLEYNPKTDSPRGYLYGYMSESENRYFFCDNHLITYWDKKSGEYSPLCSKRGCSHDTMDCIAYTTKIDASLRESVYYYDGYVYLLGIGDGVYANLYRIKEDGSEFEKYFTFYRAESFNDAKIAKLCFHRGYLYYVIPSQSTMKLQRLKLGDNKSEIVYEMSGERQNLYRVRAYGNHIFFQAGNFVDDKMMEINAGIFEYDLTTDEVKTVLDGVIREYGIYGNNLYYDKDNCIYELNFSDMSSAKIIDNIGEKRKSGKIAYYDLASDDKKWKVLDLGIDI